MVSSWIRFRCNTTATPPLIPVDCFCSSISLLSQLSALTLLPLLFLLFLSLFPFPPLEALSLFLAVSVSLHLFSSLHSPSCHSFPPSPTPAPVLLSWSGPGHPGLLGLERCPQPTHPLRNSERWFFALPGVGAGDFICL